MRKNWKTLVIAAVTASAVAAGLAAYRRSHLGFIGDDYGIYDAD